MPLVHDIRAGFEELRERDYAIRDDLDQKAWALVTIPYPDAPTPLRDGELTIQVKLSSSGRFFSLYSPVAMITDTLEASVLEHLLRRQFFADQVGGAGIAIQDINDVDVLTVVDHWMLDHISVDDFAQMFDTFMQAVFTLIDEIGMLVEKGQPIQPMHG